MSKVMNSDEIEDVVSSVRRLVSPDVRPRIVSRDPGQDKLLLTPALQVAPDGPRPAPLILTERAVEPEGRIASDSQDATAGLFDDLLVDVQAPAADEAWRAEGRAPAADVSTPVVDEAAGPSARITEPALDSEWEDAFWSEPEPTLSEIALEAEEAELVTSEPDLASPDLSLWLDEAQTMTPDSASVAEGLASLTDANGNPVTVLDEAALNDIVRALIREELQGVLGERITQNVRKLVRAEINRALTARSLD